MSTALPTIGRGVGVGWPVTDGLTAVNDVLGFAGKGGVGLSVSGGRNLEEERIGEEGGEKPIVATELCIGIRGTSTSALRGAAVWVRTLVPKNTDSTVRSHEVKRGELDGVLGLSSCSAERMSINLGSTFSGAGLDTIVDALLDEEDDVVEFKPTSTVFNPIV